MSRRNTISREFFATIAAVLVLGLSVMCAIRRHCRLRTSSGSAKAR